MEFYTDNPKHLNIKVHEILCAYTSEPDYEMSKIIILDRNAQGNYLVIEGSHCSCYDFDEASYGVTAYSHAELKTLVKAKLKCGFYKKEEKLFWQMVSITING